MLTKKWWKAAAIRALRTFGQAALTAIPVSATLVQQVNWLAVLSSGALAAFISLLTSMTFGIPEAAPAEIEEADDGTAE